MTTGYWMTGPWTSIGLDKFHAGKSWSGGDGKTIEDRYTYKPKWNSYEMAHGKFRSKNPNQIGYYEKATGVVHVRGNHDFYNVYGPLGGAGWLYQQFPTSLFNTYWTPRQELALLSKLLKKVKGHDLDLGVSLAEVDKLATTVSSTLHNLAYGAIDLANARFASFARRFGAAPPRLDRVRRLVLADVPARFLEMRYAWEPTIKDCFEAATAFEQISSGPRQSRFKATKRRQAKFTVHTNYGCPVEIAVEVMRTYIFEQYEEMGFARQLGLTNPATVLWERVPWSFVVDWFIPIGSYLNLIGQIPFMKGRWLRTSSIRQTARTTVQHPETSDYSPRPPYPDCDSNRFNLLRDTDFPFPPGVPFPNFSVQGAIQGKRVMNAIALASQVFLKLGNKDGGGNFLSDIDLGGD